VAIVVSCCSAYPASYCERTNTSEVLSFRWWSHTGVWSHWGARTDVSSLDDDSQFDRNDSFVSCVCVCVCYVILIYHLFLFFIFYYFLNLLFEVFALI